MKHESHKMGKCPNCEFIFNNGENFCPKCGQKNHDLNVPLKHIIEEFFESTLHLDSKSFRTIKLLILKPGFLSQEYNSGKRVNYVPPIRLYVLISFLFFFLLNILTGSHNDSSGVAENSSGSVKKHTESTDFNYMGIKTSELAGKTLIQTDSLMKAKSVPNNNFNRNMIYKLRKIANGGMAEFLHSILKNISYIMFVLMPLFGVWIFIFNRKILHYYIEGLILSIHFHSMVFFILTILLLVGAIINFNVLFLLGFIFFPIYMFLMFKNVLGQSFGITVLKTGVIGILYFVSLIYLLMITIFGSALLV